MTKSNPREIAEKFWDIIIVGGGPAGMSAAIYAAADGFDVLVLEKRGVVGGQMRHSPALENVPGFHHISGEQLAVKMASQAGEMGAHFEYLEAGELFYDGPVRGVVLKKVGLSVLPDTYVPVLRSRTVVAASGAWFRRLALATTGPLEQKAVYYHGPIYPDAYKNKDVVVVGGGNAAAQNVLELSAWARKVTVLCRGPRPTWSAYLEKRIHGHPGIKVRCSTYLDGVKTGNGLEALVFTATSAAYETIPCSGIFVLSGQVPQVDWVRPKLAMHGGRIATGENVREWADGFRTIAKRLPLETSVPGVFAIGDCRDGVGHGVGNAIGDGSAVVTSIWNYLLATDRTRAEALLPAVPDSSRYPVPLSSASS